ncbi:MAG: hypothetical protein QHD01_02870 [Bradyrhizobium sp.]|uniref:hypothetical protein n=1 Tax=Bradyrhizobium sp. TaxID=376 RepID=UPI0029A279AE|nr:hypothetical protein [Bradyrhizobium sp.]MDX3965527.1 hypothetical protein [Bradyrhizobium sp.]
MFEDAKHWYRLRKLVRERRATQEFYDKEYEKAETSDEQQSVLALMFQEVGVLDEEIGFLVSQYVQKEAAHLQIPTPPFSQTGGKWIEGDYTSGDLVLSRCTNCVRSSERKRRSVGSYGSPA